jgi:hypothetical protein
VKPLRGPTKVQFLGNCHEVAELSEFHTINRTFRCC